MVSLIVTNREKRRVLLAALSSHISITFSSCSKIGISISQKAATAVMGVLSVVVLLYLLSNIFWWTLFSSGFMVAVHAVLRDASMHKDADDKVVMSGDLNLDVVHQEQASFLNNAGDAV